MENLAYIRVYITVRMWFNFGENQSRQALFRSLIQEFYLGILHYNEDSKKVKKNTQRVFFSISPGVTKQSRK